MSRCQRILHGQRLPGDPKFGCRLVRRCGSQRPLCHDQGVAERPKEHVGRRGYFIGILWDFMGFYGIYPMVMTHIANWKITIFNGKIHYFDWAIFHSYVKLPEGIQKNPIGSLNFTAVRGGTRTERLFGEGALARVFPKWMDHGTNILGLMGLPSRYIFSHNVNQSNISLRGCRDQRLGTESQ